LPIAAITLHAPEEICAYWKILNTVSG